MERAISGEGDKNAYHWRHIISWLFQWFCIFIQCSLWSGSRILYYELRYFGERRCQSRSAACFKATCKRTHYCWMLHVAFVCTTRLHVVACFCGLLRVVAQSLKLNQTFTTTCKGTQQLPTLLGQKCWELLSSFTRSIKTYRWSDSSHEFKVISWPVENKEKKS